jgi:hypothetical protein
MMTRTSESLWHCGVLSKPCWATPVLHKHGDVLKIEMLHEAGDIRRVSSNVVPLGVSHLVGLAEADVIGPQRSDNPRHEVRESCSDRGNSMTAYRA